MKKRITGIVAAAHTPFDGVGDLNLPQIPRIVDQLETEGVSALYVCGTTGEGMSLTREEREQVAEAYIAAAGNRLPVIVQVGHNSLTEARRLAAHAQKAGAYAISASSPSYIKPATPAVLADCMAMIAAGAPIVPFYYYHIPILTGAELDMLEFLRIASRRIPNLVGAKYTTPTLHEYQACMALDGGRFDLLWGTDEMLLGALAVGAQGAIGSTYNIAAPLYAKLIRAFEAGNLEKARRLQAHAVTMVREMCRFPFHAAMKEVLKMIGLNCGACRLPHPGLSAEETSHLRASLEQIGFFTWARPDRTSSVSTTRGALEEV